MVPFIIIYLFNWIIFIIIIASLLRKSFSSKLKNVKMEKKTKSKSIFKQQFLIAITLSVLFGLGWGLGLLVTEDIYTNKTVRDLFASLFVILTAFHGLLIFIMHCLRSKDAHDVWNKVFFGVTGREFTEFSSSTFNRVRGKSSGARSTTMRSSNRKFSSEKSPSFTFSEGKRFSAFKHGDGQATLREYTKKNEEELRGGVVGEKEVEDLPAIQDTDFNFEEDGQGTLRFYAKRNKDLEPQLDTLNDKSSTKEEAQPVAKSAAIEHLELALNTPSDEVKKSVKKEETISPSTQAVSIDSDDSGPITEKTVELIGKALDDVIFPVPPLELTKAKELFPSTTSSSFGDGKASARCIPLDNPFDYSTCDETDCIHSPPSPLSQHQIIHLNNPLTVREEDGVINDDSSL